MNLLEMAELAKSQLASVTGLKPVTVTGTFKDELGWRIALEMVELCRIPPCTDVLGQYEVSLDASGIMLGFVRKRTRLRGEAVEEKATA